jgi:hypothetical protein
MIDAARSITPLSSGVRDRKASGKWTLFILVMSPLSSGKGHDLFRD